MRIAHVITRLIVGGAQENTLLTVESQHADPRDEVALLTGPPLGPEGSLLPRAERGGFKLEVIDDLRRSIHPLRDWRACRKLTSALRDWRPDIVHTHSSKAGILGRVAAERLGIPAVHTIHGAAFHYGQHPLAYRAYVAAEHRAGRRTAHFISVADAMTDAYVAAGIARRERFTTVYSGFEVEPFLNPVRARDEVRRGLGLSSDHVVIAKVARLFHLKGHEFVLAAAPEVIASHPHVRFLFIGEGILRERYQREIEARGLAEHFLFTGLVAPETIPELLHASDVVVHTSQWEGLARVLPQALIAGRPVVSYDVGGAREVVIPNETGFLLPRDSVRGLTVALKALVGDPALRSQFGRSGRERFTDAFRHDTMARRIREIYQAVLEPTAQPPPQAAAP